MPCFSTQSYELILNPAGDGMQIRIHLHGPRGLAKVLFFFLLAEINRDSFPFGMLIYRGWEPPGDRSTARHSSKQTNEPLSFGPRKRGSGPTCLNTESPLRGRTLAREGVKGIHMYGVCHVAVSKNKTLAAFSLTTTRNLHLHLHQGWAHWLGVWISWR